MAALEKKALLSLYVVHKTVFLITTQADAITLYLIACDDRWRDTAALPLSALVQPLHMFKGDRG